MLSPFSSHVLMASDGAFSFTAFHAIKGLAFPVLVEVERRWSKR
jgi:hypothetical protein